MNWQGRFMIWSPDSSYMLFLIDFQNIHIKEWTAHASPDGAGDPDYIVVVTNPMYTIAGSTWKTDLHEGCKKKKVLGERTSPTKASTSETIDMNDGDDMDIGFSDDCEIELTEGVTDTVNAKKKGEFVRCELNIH